MGLLPRYPIYIPSKGRSAHCLTARFLEADAVPYSIVVEPSQEAAYRSIPKEYGTLLVLPHDGMRLLGARNWIKEHATLAGHERHWQLDDNCYAVRRWHLRKRIRCASGPAFAACEDFVDRYTNVAVAGMNYHMFAHRPSPTPYVLNSHVYSCSLILNSLPHRWRLLRNDDTDFCLQVLADGWCTIQFNAFVIEKVRTMAISGGNTSDLYQDDGRLKMSRDLERMWPGVVTTKRRFGRPQHCVAYAWQHFDTPLCRKPDLVVPDGPDEYGLSLVEIAPIMSASLRGHVAAHGASLRSAGIEPGARAL